MPRPAAGGSHEDSPLQRKLVTTIFSIVVALPVRIKDDDQRMASQDVGGVRAHGPFWVTPTRSSEQLGTSTEAIQRTVDGARIADGCDGDEGQRRAS